MASTINVEKLLQWLGENQVRLHPDIEVRQSKLGGIGVYAVKDLDPEELFYEEVFDDEESGEEDDCCGDGHVHEHGHGHGHGGGEDEGQNEKEDGTDDEDGEMELGESDHEPNLQPMPLARIPKTSIFSAQNSYISNLLDENEVTGVTALILAFLYEYELQDQSPWHGYFHSFDLDSIDVPPSFWSHEEQEMLKGTEASVLQVADNEEISHVFEVCCDFAYLVQEELGNIKTPAILRGNLKGNDNEARGVSGEEQKKVQENLRKFAKVSVLISSRCFNIDSFHEFALVPAADLFNHSSSECNCHFESNFEVCEICGMVECSHMEDEEPSDDELGDGEQRMEVDEEGEWEDEGEEQPQEEEQQQQEEEEEIEEVEEVEKATEITEDMIAELEAEEEAINDTAQEIEDDTTSDKEGGGESLEQRNEDHLPEYLRGHTHPDNAPFYSIDCCDIVLHKKASKGDELFSTYGDLCNPLLLLKYQFTELDNENDYVSLSKQLLHYKKLNVRKLGERFKWWQEVGHETFRDWVKEQYRGEEDDDDDSDDEEDDGFEEDEEGQGSWVTDSKIYQGGNISHSLQGLIRLLTITDQEFTRYFQPDAVKPKANKNKKAKTQKHIKKQQLSAALADTSGKYFQKLVTNMPVLTATDAQFYTVLEKLLLERFDDISFFAPEEKKQIAKGFRSDMTIDDSLQFVAEAGKRKGITEGRKKHCYTIVFNELRTISAALEKVRKQ